MTLHQLKVFITIVKSNSFAKAARALRISQPSVSGVVKDLQGELGVRLFERLGNKRQLTEAGKRLFDRALHSISIIDRIRDDLDELQGLKKGTLSIGAAGIATPLILQTLHRFKTKYPGIDVHLIIQKTIILYQKLLDGELDIAIVARPSPSPLILAEPYREEDIVFIAPAKHPLARKRSVSLKLLAREPWIGYEDGPIAERIAKKLAGVGLAYNLVFPINLQLGGREALRSAVVNGLGIGYQTKCHVLGDVKAGRIAILNVPELRLSRKMYIAVHKNRADLSLLYAFKNLLGAKTGRKNASG